MIRTIWNNVLLKEFFLMLVATVGVQLALGLNELLSAIEIAEDWGDLLTSTQTWVAAFGFALVVTAVKQSIVFVISKLMS